MIRPQPSAGFTSAGILSAIAASLCCVTPFIALFASSSSIVGNFAWIEPARPYLIGISIVALASAWFLKLKPSSGKDIGCTCDTDCRTPFIQSKTFLGIVTFFAVVMMTFPLYAKVFYPKSNEQIVIAPSVSESQQVQFSIQGMTCSACEGHVDQELGEVVGVLGYKTSYDSGTSLVSYDSTKVEIESIEAAIKKTGYHVAGRKIIKP